MTWIDAPDDTGKWWIWFPSLFGSGEIIHSFVHIAENDKGEKITAVFFGSGPYTVACVISDDRLIGCKYRRLETPDPPTIREREGNMNRFVSLLALIFAGILIGCDDKPAAPPPPAKAEVPTLNLIFTYSSEKEGWIKAETAKFNDSAIKTTAGNVIHVEAISMGSGDIMDELINDRRKPHMISPASVTFLDAGNAQWKVKTGKDLSAKPTSLVLSPVVVAMWKPMADALGYGNKPIGWAEIISIAQDPAGWSTLGHSEWGNFKFGHTHPEYSNSGLVAVIAETYAGAGKKAGLTLADVNAPDTVKFLGGIEKSVVHYGTSSGFFAKKMFAQGPEYISAAVLYESNVIESQGVSVMPIVAIYPKEGTSWADHPIAVVNREWVNPECQSAAKIFIDRLTGPEAQKSAMNFGFRPSDPSIVLSDKFSKANGVDPAEPKTTLETPNAQVSKAIIDVWRANKKPANIVVVFDTSGSMNEENRIGNARQAALDFTGMLNDNDLVSFLPFSTKASWRAKSVAMKTGRSKLNQEISGVFAGGGTALYDTIKEATDYIEKNPKPGYINAVVVMTDGEDTDSTTTLDALLASIQTSSKGERRREGVRVFTVGYGSDAKMDVLKRISEATNAKEYKGNNDNIRAIFKEIATFF